MLRTCKYCGKQYDGDPGGSCCPECAAEQRKTTLRERICQTCGRSFSGGPAARYCPECRAERRRIRDRIFKRNGPARPLGSTDLCVVCGQPYIVTGGTQRYCPECAADAVRAKDRAASRAWSAAHTTAEERRTVRRTATAEIPCAICGKMFVPLGQQSTCSEECRREQKRRAGSRWEAGNKAQRSQTRKAARLKKEAAMTPAEYREYREKINAKARAAYAKRKAQKKDSE